MAKETPVPDVIRHAEVRVFVPSRFHLYLAVGTLVLFLAAAVGSVWLALANPDGSFAHPMAAAVFFTCGWGGMALLSLYLLVAYFRMSVLAAEGAVRINGVFRRRTVVLPEVTRAVWRGWPAGGCLVLYGRAGRVTLRFGSYHGAQELVGIFRDNLPPEVQEGFSRFEAMNTPHSAAFRRRQEKDRQSASILAPVLGTALIACAIWDP
jgi:hypothetical protein